MTTGNDLATRRLMAADAPACDAIVRSLPYHFGDPDGRRDCAEAVRRDAGLVAVRDGRVLGFLTVVHHFEATSEITWMAVHAGHRDRGVGRALIRRLTDQLRAEGRRLEEALDELPDRPPRQGEAP